MGIAQDRNRERASSRPRLVAIDARPLFALMALLIAFATGCSTGSIADQKPRWNSADVGPVGVEGATVVVTGAGARVLTGSGADVWSEVDGFHYSFVSVSGDGSLTVRVDSIDAAHAWTKVGVMIRAGLSASAPNAFVYLTEANGALFQGRLVEGGPTEDILPDGRWMREEDAIPPWWLRIERSGEEIIGSQSVDGSSWSELGRLVVPLPETVLIGAAVTSRNNATTASGTFTDVTLQLDGRVEEQPAPDPAPDPDPAPAPAPPPVPGPITGPTTTVSYARDGSDVPNPERGFFVQRSSGDYDQLAAQGFRLVGRGVRLDDFRNQPIPTWFLEELRSDLEAARGSGVKLIMRFSYNSGFQPDAPVGRVLEHIGQLTPVLQEYADVIAVLQAGFIGAWGEWHGSTNGLLTLENRQAITDALLVAVPSDRMIQLRYPRYGRDMFELPTASTAFSGSNSARVGQNNDCFLTSSHDTGTYESPADFTYAETVTRYTVMGGETCDVHGLSSYNDGWRAVEQMARFHYDYLNLEFWRPIIDKWRAQGYFDEISRRLGYRYVMQQATVMDTVEAGQTLSLSVRIENEGFGKLYNPRPLELVLVPRAGDAPVVLRAYEDARTVLPLAGETRDLMLHVRVPSELAPGTYDLQLALPDAASTLASDPRYAIRMANTNTWLASSGRNDLQLSVQVTR